MMVCLDSDILIDFLRNKSYAVEKVKELSERNVEISTTSINTFELIKGAMRSNQVDAMEVVYSLISNLKVLDFDFNASKKASEIFEELRRGGNLIDPLDLIIASIAIVNGETFLTRNLSHFKRISELEIEKL